METGWQQYLASAGANIRDGVVHDFGDANGELDAARTQNVVADLSHLGVLEFTGADAEIFLQGQLTCDVASITSESAGYGSYCSAQGRMLASFLLWRVGEVFRMVLSRSILASVHKRLRMYVLRSKVQIVDCSDSFVLLGAKGPTARNAVEAMHLPVPAPVLGANHSPEGTSVVALTAGQFLVAVLAKRASETWSVLAVSLRPVGTPCWEWIEVQRGIPFVTAATQERFVPQMANLDLIGGVSFRKGCFTGQEVVARTQHLGKIKRRMFIAHVDTDRPPRPGDDLFSDDIPGQASGSVVNSQLAPGGGYDLLAVVHLSSREASNVHLRSTDGPVMRFLDMPYEVA